VQDLLWETADIARFEISNAPERIAGQPGTWTRLTGVLVRVEAALANLELLEGPSLPEIKQMTVNCRQMNTPPERIVSEAMNALASTLHLSESDATFKAPGDED
jgi:hypothetical protein